MSLRWIPIRNCRATRRDELVGTMAHPLNRPVFDAEQGRVVEGYTILQPRVGVSLPSAQRSWFVRLFRGDAGIDPYTRVVSDVYQDLFGEGSFIGKGIYDVDAFEQSLRRLSREHDSEPRFDRGRLLPLGACSATWNCTRNIPRAIRGRYQPAASLDSRRLADRRLAAAAGAGAGAATCAQPDLRRFRGGRSSTTCAAAWCRSQCCCCC